MPKTLPAGRPIRIALCGNPNTGKSTLFGALSGVRQRVGNYPGVTVEKKLGSARMNGRDYTIIDLPGTYSLAPQSMDEMVSVDVLLGRQEDVGQPDAIVCIVDASNLQRNLYLVCQVLELHRPTVVALNMTDVASAKGIDINVALLAERIGVTVVPIQANSRKGLDGLKQAIVQSLEKPVPAFHSPFSEAFCAEVQTIYGVSSQESSTPLPHYLIQRLILDTGYLHEAKLPGVTTSVMSAVDSARQRLAATSDELVSMEPIARYSWINQVTHDVIHRPDQHRATLSDRIDHVVTHRLFGTGIFALLMLIIFQAVFGFAPFFSDLIESGVGGIGGWVGGLLPPGALRSLMLNGVFAGVGGVLVFLPQIAILFLFIAILEDCGYMSRAAYLMDKSMSAIGLNGKSFIPLLSSFACAVPGIMAARVIENRRDRFITILVAPLMSCSARIPVYVLLTSAFIPSFTIVPWILSSRSLVFFLMYFIGI
ncbi:MAG: ferrous iron transport protein B, partial [Planctomycetales bacterium]|nr:ferrous iron transport protein B [Planctomycetales bacterium]